MARLIGNVVGDVEQQLLFSNRLAHNEFACFHRMMTALHEAVRAKKLSRGQMRNNITIRLEVAVYTLQVAMQGHLDYFQNGEIDAEIGDQFINIGRWVREVDATIAAWNVELRKLEAMREAEERELEAMRAALREE
jgi:hypothetical protein